MLDFSTNSIITDQKFTDEMPLIAQNLRKVYRKSKTVAVVNVTFAVPSGECFGIVGLEGSGKTTTLKMLTGDVIPSGGDSWIGNSKLRTNPTQVRSLTQIRNVFFRLIRFLNCSTFRKPATARKPISHR